MYIAQRQKWPIIEVLESEPFIYLRPHGRDEHLFRNDAFLTKNMLFWQKNQ